MSDKKYVFISAITSFIIPIILMALVAFYGFGPAESDSAEVQGFIFTLMLFPFIFLFQLLAYWVLGKSQRKRIKPSLFLGGAVGAALALPLSALVLALAITTGATIWQAIFGAVLYMFFPLWASFFVGSSVQYFFMVRNA
ncbi:hypothetical protein ACWOKN_004361 [Vibrio vulnificus]|nr:hypothetical protein [Vibrio vulnificus]